MGDTRVMHRRCSAGARSVHRQCIGDTQLVHSRCIGDAWPVHSQCAGDAQPVHWRYTDNWFIDDAQPASAWPIHGWCTASAELVHRRCTAGAWVVHSQYIKAMRNRCAAHTQPVHGRCTDGAQSMHRQWPAGVQVLHGRCTYLTKIPGPGKIMDIKLGKIWTFFMFTPFSVFNNLFVSHPNTVKVVITVKTVSRHNPLSPETVVGWLLKMPRLCR